MTIRHIKIFLAVCACGCNTTRAAEDDVIDMVSWCGRNVVDYQISYDSVRDFLDTVGTFFVFLKQKLGIRSTMKI